MGQSFEFPGFDSHQGMNGRNLIEELSVPCRGDGNSPLLCCAEVTGSLDSRQRTLETASMRTPRFSTVALLGLLVASFILRAAAPRMMSVEHFDEGVYASNLFSEHIGFRYPDRQYYAPPLLPAIFEWVLILTGGAPHAVMWVNVFLGTALVAAVYWCTKELLNSSTGSRIPNLDERDHLISKIAVSAALAAAAVIAFSDLFAEYSRAALTDIPVCLWITLAVGSGARAFRTGRWRWGAAAGIWTAIAWWTKYNGWLPLAILGAGLAGWLLFTRCGRASLLAPAASSAVRSMNRKLKSKPPVTQAPSREGIVQLGQWGMIAAVAAILWAPYLSELQSCGGYAAVAANHKNYIVGLNGWASSALRHLQVDQFYSSWRSALGVAVGSLLAWMALKMTNSQPLRDRKYSVHSFLFFAGATAFSLAVTFAGSILPLLVAASLVVVFWNRLPRSDSQWPTVPLGMWILLAWIAGLTLATPMYRPYPRLILPWMVALYIAAATGIAQTILTLCRPNSADETDAGPAAAGKISEIRHSEWRTSGQTILVLAVPILAAVLCVSAGHPRFLENRRGLEEAAKKTIPILKEDLATDSRSAIESIDCVIYVLAEPGLYYHLAALEGGELEFITQPASDLGMLSSGKIDPRVPAYLITGPHAVHEGEELKELTHRVRHVAEIPYVPSSLVLLDDVPPSELKGQTRQSLLIWRVVAR